MMMVMMMMMMMTHWRHKHTKGEHQIIIVFTAAVMAILIYITVLYHLHGHFSDGLMSVLTAMSMKNTKLKLDKKLTWSSLLGVTMFGVCQEPSTSLFSKEVMNVANSMSITKLSSFSAIVWLLQAGGNIATYLHSLVS
eukprot:6280847-Karenia_brevis.AAC.1